MCASKANQVLILDGVSRSGKPQQEEVRRRGWPRQAPEGEEDPEEPEITISLKVVLPGYTLQPAVCHGGLPPFPVLLVGEDFRTPAEKLCQSKVRDGVMCRPKD